MCVPFETLDWRPADFFLLAMGLTYLPTLSLQALDTLKGCTQLAESSLPIQRLHLTFFMGLQARLHQLQLLRGQCRLIQLHDLTDKGLPVLRLPTRQLMQYFRHDHFS